jgi:hypothetical protein
LLNNVREYFDIPGALRQVFLEWVLGWLNETENRLWCCHLSAQSLASEVHALCHFNSYNLMLIISFVIGLFRKLSKVGTGKG